jgi:predicted nucleic acid-binding protein
MKRFLLDTSALLALRDGEPGSDQVADLLYQAQRGKTLCLICFMSLMEILYRVWRDENESAGLLACEQCRSLPLQVVHESRPLLERAARIKATKRLFLADSWIAAAALQEGATLVHKDPEFTSLDCSQIDLSKPISI